MNLTDTQQAQLQRAPNLVRLATAGQVWESPDGAIEGRASDGVVVCLGSTFDIPGTEHYLAAHPTPDTW